MQNEQLANKQQANSKQTKCKKMKGKWNCLPTAVKKYNRYYGASVVDIKSISVCLIGSTCKRIPFCFGLTVTFDVNSDCFDSPLPL